MKIRILALLFVLSAPLAASATCTWTAHYTGVQAVCTTGTEANAPTATDGLALSGPGWFSVKALSVHIETGSAMTAGGVLQAYLYNPVSGRWNRSPDFLDLSVGALTGEAWFGLPVLFGAERIAWLPSGVGVASVIYINKG